LTTDNGGSEAPYRQRFKVQDANVAYLDGNSLGRLPLATIERLEEVVQREWGEGLIGSWNQAWLPLSRRIGDKIGQLIGAIPGETLVCDSTSINLYKAAWALLQHRGQRRKIVTDAGNFPTDLYVLESLRQQCGVDLQFEPVRLDHGDHAQVHATLAAALDDETALLCLSHVNYKTGYAFDLDTVTGLANAVGAKTLWDLSHSVGAVPLDLRRAGAAAAVGCTYKYLNGGPGSPAFIWVRKEHLSDLHNPIPGWFGADRPFDFGSHYAPHPGIERFAVGTPPILSLAAVECGVDLTCEAGIETLRERGWQLMQRFFQHYDERLQDLGFQLVTPRSRDAAGSHISFRHDAAWQITQDLIQSHQVVPDFRGPDLIRFGLTPLYTLVAEVDRAAQSLALSVSSGSYRAYPEQRVGVT
jgi:kynureninase